MEIKQVDVFVIYSCRVCGEYWDYKWEVEFLDIEESWCCVVWDNGKFGFCFIGILLKFIFD